MKVISNIDLILIRMVELLRVGGDAGGWCSALDGVRADFHRDPEYASSRLLSMYGGMGSLNDVVLYRGGQPMVAENNEFDMLRVRLYGLVKK